MCGTFLGVQAPVQAYRGYAPPVENTEIVLSSVAPQSVPTGKRMHLYNDDSVADFTLVGVTWQGVIDPTTVFEVRVRELGKWSEWNELHWSREHGADGDSSEAQAARQGTDPLLTAPADGVALRATNHSGALPTSLSLSLVNSNLTAQDRSLISTRAVATTFPSTVTSPQGAVVARPNLITRAQWGANEKWRNQDPGMGTKIIAGFLHHTASTNSYSADLGPAQMRNLYSYYTRSLHYKDLAYNFLIDKYGNVYEGRSGCPRVATSPCDGPARPAIGAHTAGMNVNTFAISAIGNFQDATPGAEALSKMDDAIAGLMAWKLAPYGLNPNAIANIPVGRDPHHLSRYLEGDIAHVLTVSGHRDVGKTVCPGQYLYPELPAIRERIATLLTPEVAVPHLTPAFVAKEATEPIEISFVITRGATWTVDVFNDIDNSIVGHADGVASKTGPVIYSWPHVDTSSALLPVGTYTVKVKQSVASISTPAATPSPTATSTPAPTPSSTVNIPTVTEKTSKTYIAAAPILTTAGTWKYRSKTRAWLTWKAATSVVPVTYKYRVFDKYTNKWSSWKSTSASGNRITVRKLKLSHRYRVQLKAVNAVGESPVRESTYVHRFVK